MIFFIEEKGMWKERVWSAQHALFEINQGRLKNRGRVTYQAIYFYLADTVRGKGVLINMGKS